MIVLFIVSCAYAAIKQKSDTQSVFCIQGSIAWFTAWNHISNFTIHLSDVRAYDFFVITLIRIQCNFILMLGFKMPAEGVFRKFCQVNSFKTFVDGLHSIRLYEEQIQ